MNLAANEPQVWSARRRWAVIAIAVVVQVGLIYWFSEHSPRPVRRADARPAFQLIARPQSEWLALNSPTMFALPHALGFSGRAWLAVPTHDYRPAEAANVPQWLALAPGTLGESFREFMRTNQSGRVAVAIRPAPALATPSVAATPATARASRVQLSAALARRGLRSQWQLPAWTNTGPLQPSEVRVVVDAFGHPLSAVLLNSSGLPAADQHALELVRRAVFGPDEAAMRSPADGLDAGLTSGRLEFYWLTLPPEGEGGTDPR